MPSRLVSTAPQFREMARAKAASLTNFVTAVGRGPFLGYIPDIPVYSLDLNAFGSCSGLSARSILSGGGHGEMLMPEPGWQRVDNDDPASSLPLGSGAYHEVVMISEFPRTNSSGAKTGVFTDTLLAWVAGDGTTLNTAELWRVNPTSVDWEQVAHTNGAGTTRPKGDRDAIPDFCSYAAGASARTAFTGNINEPIFIITNNIDPVYTFPSGTGTSTFEDLTDDTDFKPFFAKSCEVFNNRVYFLNTSEAGTRYRQRLRRTPPFTADPDNSQVGAGATDLKDFTGDGLRAERLGTVLALYFSDGVAFARPTGNYTAPDAFQTVSTSRGLVSTHALTNIGNDLHFGIFTDGWFELDPSGRFNEVGLVNNSGTVMAKWKDTFYDLIAKDPTKRARLYVQYEQSANRIYISVPTDSDAENAQVWVYDRESDRVWLDQYEALCWGNYNRQISGAPTYATVTGTYASIVGTYASLEARYGIQALAHTTARGYVFQHEPNRIVRDVEALTGNASPTWHLETHHFPGNSPRFLNTLDRVTLEYINFMGSAMTIRVDDGSSSQTTQTVQVNTGSAGDIRTAKAYFRHTGQQLSIRISGSGPFMLKSYEADAFDEALEEMNE